MACHSLLSSATFCQNSPPWLVHLGWPYMALPDVQAGFRKGRGTRDQIANIHWIIKKARELQKNIYFCFVDCAKAFDCVDHNTLWNILQEMGIPDHLTCLLRNLYAGQEATVRTGHGTTDWLQIGKGVHQGCILSPCLFKLKCRVHHEKCWTGWITSWSQVAGRNINLRLPQSNKKKKLNNLREKWRKFEQAIHWERSQDAK